MLLGGIVHGWQRQQALLLEPDCVNSAGGLRDWPCPHVCAAAGCLGHRAPPRLCCHCGVSKGSKAALHRSELHYSSGVQAHPGAGWLRLRRRGRHHQERSTERGSQPACSNGRSWCGTACAVSNRMQVLRRWSIIKRLIYHKARKTDLMWVLASASLYRAAARHGRPDRVCAFPSPGGVCGCAATP